MPDDNGLLLRELIDAELDPRVLLRPVRDAAGEIVDFVYVDANVSACEYNRRSREELLGSSLLTMLPGHRESGLLRRYADVVETGEPLVLNDVRYDEEHRDGGEVYFDIRVTRAADGISLTWRDVSDRFRSARALAASEARYRLLAENMSDLVVLCDVAGRIEWLSPSVERGSELSSAELLGRSPAEFVHPDDREALVDAWRRVAAGERVSLRLRVGRDGGAHSWFAVMMHPVFDAEGAFVGRVSALRDVQAETVAEQALAASEQKFRLLAENVGDVILHGRGTEVAWVSPSLTEALGWQPSDWIGSDVLDYVHADDLEVARPNAILRSEVPVRTRLRLRGADGEHHWIESRARAYLGADGEQDGWISSFRVIDDVVRAEEELDRSARFDSLTGLVNRREILEELASTFTRVPRTGRRTAVLFCDVDRFKAVNDVHGHAAGDEVLRTLAERITQCVRRDDIVARIGGDELLILLTGVHGPQEADAIAEKVRARADEPITMGSLVLTATLSIGVTLSLPGESTDDVVARADAAMYQAKGRGGNRVVSL